MSETFDSLTVAPKERLDQLMHIGTFPALEDVRGYEFRGWNLQPATALLGTRKFKKGFFGEAGQPFIWGYNVPVQQNGKQEPWIAKPSDENPKRYFFFKVLLGDAADRPIYPKSLVVDYRKWEAYSALNLVRFTVDYLVYPEPSNRDLILGKSYWEAGSVHPFMGFFVLERHNRTDYEHRWP